MSERWRDEITSERNFGWVREIWDTSTTRGDEKREPVITHNWWQLLSHRDGEEKRKTFRCLGMLTTWLPLFPFPSLVITSFYPNWTRGGKCWWEFPVSSNVHIPIHGPKLAPKFCLTFDVSSVTLSFSLSTNYYRPNFPVNTRERERAMRKKKLIMMMTMREITVGYTVLSGNTTRERCLSFSFRTRQDQ